VIQERGLVVRTQDRLSSGEHPTRGLVEELLSPTFEVGSFADDKIDLRTAGAFWNNKAFTSNEHRRRRFSSGELDSLSFDERAVSLAYGDSFQVREQGLMHGKT